MPDASLSHSNSPAEPNRKSVTRTSSTSPTDAAGASSAHASPTTSKPASGADNDLDNDNEPSSPPRKKRPTTAALHLDQYVTRDQLHAAALAEQQESANELIRAKTRESSYYGKQVRAERQRNPGAIFGYGYAGFGNGFTDGNPRVLYPCQRKRPGGRKAREVRLSRKQIKEQAELPETLVPVRLDVDFDKIKLRDTFTWNLHERTIPVDLFVEQLVEDFHLPVDQRLIQNIANSMKEQVNEFHPHVILHDEPLDPKLPYTAYKNDDMRILIKINITIGQHMLVDQFEWDINNPANSPEEFAQLLTREMSLAGEFTTAIAHCIREQTQLFTRALYVTSHPFDGRPIEDEDVRSAMMPSPLPSVFRPHMLQKDFTPILSELSDYQLDRAEKARSRQDRLRNRAVRGYNRRGGPTIPDLKDMPKTHRTQIVSSVLPGAVAKLSELEKTMKTKEIKDGDESGDESESEAEDVPPEKLIPNFHNMTKRQQQKELKALADRNAAAQAAQAAAVARSSAAQEVGAGRSATPEIQSTPARLRRHDRDNTPQHPSAGRRAPSTPAQTPMLQIPPPPPSHGESPASPPPPPLPRRPGAPLNVDSAVLILKFSPQKLQKLLSNLAQQDRARAEQAEAERREQQQQQQQQEQEQERQRQQEQERQRQQQQQQQQKQTSMPPPPPPPVRAPTSPHQQSPQKQPPASTSPSPAPASSSPAAAATPTASSPANPDPVPTWLLTALSNLNASYPDDRFEGTMRFSATDPATGQVVPQNAITDANRDRLTFRWTPRIRCSDCPGKLYTPGPEKTVENFVMHLKNRGHRERVEQRKAKEAAAAAAGGGGGGASA